MEEDRHGFLDKARGRVEAGGFGGSAWALGGLGRAVGEVGVDGVGDCWKVVLR